MKTTDNRRRPPKIRVAFAASLLIVAGIRAAYTQTPNQAAAIHLIDAAVAERVDKVLTFTDVEHYSVYRGNDETHAVAEMTVRDSYEKGVGKKYTVLSESGSGIILRFGLKPLIDNETAINQPGKVAESWFTSANYVMELKPGGTQKLNGRDCYVLTIRPRRAAPNMVAGTLWADVKDGTLVQIDGVASKKPSVFAGATHMMRRYANIDGFAMAMHARAESNSMFFGRTVVVIDYSDYRLQLRQSK